MRALLSFDPVTSLAPSRLAFKLVSGIRVPVEIADALALIDVQSLAFLSAEAENSEFPSLSENASARIFP